MRSWVSLCWLQYSEYHDSEAARCSNISARGLVLPYRLGYMLNMDLKCFSKINHSLPPSIFSSAFSDSFQKYCNFPCLRNKQSKHLESIDLFFLKCHLKNSEANKPQSTKAAFLFIYPAALLHVCSLKWDGNKVAAGIYRIYSGELVGFTTYFNRTRLFLGLKNFLSRKLNYPSWEKCRGEKKKENFHQKCNVDEAN